MKRLACTITALVLGAVGLGLTSASSASADQSRSPWTRYHQPDLTVPAGRACTFAVDEHVVNDKEYYRVISTYDDGTDKVESWKGLLVITFTNADTGTSVTKNINGRGLIEYAPDGAFTKITILSGHFVGTIPPGNTMDPGLYYVSGKGSSETVNPDGTRTLDLGPQGSADNLCTELAG